MSSGAVGLLTVANNLVVNGTYLWDLGSTVSTDISTSWLTQGYLAYGSRDQRFKYGL